MGCLATCRRIARANLAPYNDVIGNYVSAGGRLHLYSYLEKLKERALYTDTDSFVFINQEMARHW